MIVFTNQENVSDEQAEQYVKWSEEGKRPDDIEIYYFLNLRYGLMSGDDELKILMKERTADRMAVYRIAKDFTNTYFQEEYTGEVEIMGIKGLSGVDTDSKGDCTVEVEFRPVQEDSLSYLFMTFGYDDGMDNPQLRTGKVGGHRIQKLWRNPTKFVDKRVLPMYNKSVCESTHRRRLVFSTQHIA